jgi:hypothetical protein
VLQKTQHFDHNLPSSVEHSKILSRGYLMARQHNIKFLAALFVLAASLTTSDSALAQSSPSIDPDAYRVQTIQRGTFEFDDTQCRADIQILKLNGKEQTTKKINQFLRAMAQLCDKNANITKNKAKATYLSQNYFSGLYQGFLLPKGAGGSCHDYSEGLLLDRQTGKRLMLTNIVSAEQLPKLFETMATAIREDFLLKNPDERGVMSVKEIINTFYNIKDYISVMLEFDAQGKLQVTAIPNFNLGSCAAGRFNKVPLPDEFIVHAGLRNELGLSPLKPNRKPLYQQRPVVGSTGNRP